MQDRTNYKGAHILSKDTFTDTDAWASGVNNNVLIFGPSGAGKTRSYVRPNIVHAHESLIVSDTKGSLCGEVGPLLERRGYRIRKIDFTDLTAGCGYNPLSYIRRSETTGQVSEQDVISLANVLIPLTSSDPFWDRAAQQYLEIIVGFVLEMLPPQEQNFRSVVKLCSLLGTDRLDRLMKLLRRENPDSTVPDRYDAIRVNSRAEKMDASIRGILSAAVNPLVFDEALALYEKKDPIDFPALGREKTAVFLTVSDTDRCMDNLANLFITQALQSLCRSADKDYADHRLPVPVRFYLDDFATNVVIPDFDKIISVIRSREIYVSVILQSITQLDSLYGSSCAKTILNNCDQMLYLGGQDIETARLISQKTDRPLSDILCLPLNKAFVFIRGSAPKLTEKYEMRTAELRDPEVSDIETPPPQRPAELEDREKDCA